MAAHFLNETLTGANGGTNGATDISWAGGSGVFITQGTFAGAIFQLQFSIDDGATWSDMPGAELTHSAASAGFFQICPCLLRVKWTGGNQGLTTNVKARVAPPWQGWWNDPNTLPTT